MLKMAEVILLRTDKEPTPEQLAKKARSLAVALHDEMLAGLTECDIVEVTKAPSSDRAPAPGIPVLGPSAPAPPLEDAPNCPECQGPMKRRNGRNGPFWGCLGYPGCRGTKNAGATSGTTKP